MQLDDCMCNVLNALLEILDLARDLKNGDQEKLKEFGRMLYETTATDVEPDCFNDALMICVEQGNLEAVAKVLLKGATDWSKFIDYSMEHQQYKVASLLYLCHAAEENHLATIKELFRPSDKTSKQTADELQAVKDVLCENGLQTVAHVPIKFGMRKKNYTAVYELLLRTDCSKEEGHADWHGLALRLVDPQWLVAMASWVKKLSLMSNFLHVIPKEVGKLVHLQRLNLAHNDLETIPSELVLLPQLKSLTLAHNRLGELPDQGEWSSSLCVLNLNNNLLKDLPKSMRTTSLKQLRVAHNPLPELPHAICLCEGLESLDISETHIAFLPNEMGRLTSLSELKTEGLDITDPGSSVMKTPKDCVRYLRQRLRGSEPYYKMKMMIVGYANRGKSTLVARLQGVDIGNLATVGIDLTEWSYSPSMLSKQKFTFQIWDFGGQKEYYATHQCFLSTRSLYIVVWRVIDGEAGIEELKMWLDNIAARAPQSPVLIVGTFLDKLSREQRQSKFSEHLQDKVIEMVTHTPRYRNVQVKAVVNVSCAKESRENIDYLKTAIYDAASEAKVGKEKIMGVLVPASYLALDRQLNKKRLQLQQKGDPPIKWKQELRDIIQQTRAASDIDNDDELDLAARFLHEIGTLLHFDDASGRLSDLYFIDPRWLCDMMAIIVTVRERNPYIRNGILKMSALPHLFKGKRFPSSLFPEYVQLLNRFEIALPLDQNHILIPSMLPDSPSAEVPVIASSAPVLRRQHSMIYIPPGFWSRLISRLLLFIKEISHFLPASGDESDLVSTTDENTRCLSSVDSLSDETDHDTNATTPSDSSLNQLSGNYEELSKSNDSEKDETSVSCLTHKISTSSLDSDVINMTSIAITETITSTIFEDSAAPLNVANVDVPNATVFPEPTEDNEWELLFSEDHFGSDIAGHSSFSLEQKRDQPQVQTVSHSSPVQLHLNSLRQRKVCDLIARMSADQFAVLKKHKVFYWKTGFCFSHPHLFFMVQQYDSDSYGRKGIETITSAGLNGCRTLSRLVDQINNLIHDWFPGLLGDDGRLKSVIQLCPCIECFRHGVDKPHIFPFEPQLVEAVMLGTEETVECEKHVLPTKLCELVPDLLLIDLDREFVLSFDEILCPESDEVKLGQGGFGAVFLGECRGQQVAIKTYFDQSGCDPVKPLSELRQEVAVLQIISHPNLVGMVGVCLKPIRLVLELAPLGALDTYLKGKQPLSRILIHRVAGQVGAALAHLHNQLIIFRDLKAANVLVWSLDPSDAINVKLTDYGIATVASPTGLKGFEGTKGFQAPEMLRFSGTEEYTCMVDIYAFAMFLYQLIARRSPFHSLGEAHITPAVLKGRRPALRDVSVSKCGFLYLTGLMRQCWVENPRSRVPAEDIPNLVHRSEFQCTLGAVNIPSTSSLIHHACLVDTTQQLWISVVSGKDVILHVYELSNLAEPMTSLVISNVMCLTIISNDSIVYVAVSALNQTCCIHCYRSIKDVEPKQLETIQETEMVTAMLPLDNQLAVCRQNGIIRIYSSNDSKGSHNSSDFQEADVAFSYPVVSIVQTLGKVWCASKRYIYTLDEEWSLDGLWTHQTIENSIASLHVSSDEETVWCTYSGRPCLSCWNAHSKGVLVRDLQLHSVLSSVQVTELNSVAIACITVVLDTIWIASRSGHLFIVDSKSDKLIHFFYPYRGDIGILLSSTGCSPCGTEKGLVVSCGRSWKPHNLMGEVMLPRNLVCDQPETTNTVVLWESLHAEELHNVVQLEQKLGSPTSAKQQFVQNAAGYAETFEWLNSTEGKLTRQPTCS